MKKSKLEPSLEESFALGKLEGEKEALQEVLDLLKDGLDGAVLMAYLKSTIRMLNTKSIRNPFKRNGK